MFASIGPVWDGNEVWLVTAGGATFAAFPAWYATMFSGFYLALLVVLFFLIIRVISFEWRSKSESPRWRRIWLWANAIGSFGASLIWGVGLREPAVRHADQLERRLRRIVLGPVQRLHPARRRRRRAALRLPRRDLPHAPHAGRPARARRPRVARGSRPSRRRSARCSWSGRSSSRSTATTRTSSRRCCPPRSGSPRSCWRSSSSTGAASCWAFAMTGLAAIAVVVTLFTSLFPRVMVSSTDFANSLTVSGSASAHYTLAVMSVVALIFVPARPALPGLDVPRLPRPSRRPTRDADALGFQPLPKRSAYRPACSRAPASASMSELSL